MPNQGGTAEAFVSESRDEGFYFTEGGRLMFDRVRKDIRAVLERDPQPGMPWRLYCAIRGFMLSYYIG